MTIGLLKEPQFEKRASLLPQAVAELIKKGHTILVEKGCGVAAFASDEDYIKAGATVTDRASALQADVLLSINPPENAGSNKTLIGVFQPLLYTQNIDVWAAAKSTVFSLDLLPRTTRAQSMDVLSSQANIAGYKAVLLAAHTYSRYLPMFMTAAGSITPAKLLVIGAGVAGLQAVATARRLGAVVEVFDTRPAVKEEVQSLGAKFVEVAGAADASAAGGYAVEQTEEYKKAQRERIAEAVAKADIIITTAQIPGKKAPVLITEEMLQTMRSGSVIIDLAAATGGNTAVTENNKTVVYNSVQIVGDSNLAASAPSDASKLYGRNIVNFLALITNKESVLAPNWNDELVQGCCLLKDGELVNERIKGMLESRA